MMVCAASRRCTSADGCAQSICNCLPQRLTGLHSQQNTCHYYHSAGAAALLCWLDIGIHVYCWQGHNGIHGCLDKRVNTG